MPRKDPEARREYNREYQRRWYQANRELQMRRVLKATRERRERGKAYVDELKSRPCVDCGVRYPPYVMDFDHVRGEKSLNRSRPRNSRLAWSRLLAELEKCEVVCANCHRMRTRARSEGRSLDSTPIPAWIAEKYVFVSVPLA
jgi:hypothetical protein